MQLYGFRIGRIGSREPLSSVQPWGGGLLSSVPAWGGEPLTSVLQRCGIILPTTGTTYLANVYSDSDLRKVNVTVTVLPDSIFGPPVPLTTVI